MVRPRRVLPLLLLAAAVPTTAQAASPDAVVAEVYGGGGNSGATLKRDFIELGNRSGAPVSAAGLSVQYLPASPSASSQWQVTPLSGQLPANGRYLVAEAAGSGGTAELPAPDGTGTIGLSATAGTVALVSGTTALTCKTAAACAADSRIVDLVGYGAATVREGTPAPAGSNTQSVARPAALPDTDVNAADFAAGDPSPTNAAGQTPGGGGTPTPANTTIEAVQGTGFRSPVVGNGVRVAGVVTAVRSFGSARGAWVQQVAARDDDVRTSPGMFVFTGAATPPVTVGDAVVVGGTVAEFRPGSATGPNQSVTQLTGATFDVTGRGTVAAEPLTAIPSNRFASMDGNTDDILAVDPAAASLDFWESRENTLVTAGGADVVGPTTEFDEAFLLLDQNATQRTARGGIAVGPGDFNPERFKYESLVPFSQQAFPVVDVGDRFGRFTGVVDYDSFGGPTIQGRDPVTTQRRGLAPETTDAPGLDELAVATYNVENLDPGDPASKFTALAQQIAGNLAAPDIVALEEVQDDNGAVDDGVVSADQTLTRLTDAIAAAGGPRYQWRQIDPTDDADGGEPGGNIRNAFLFRTDRGLAFVDRAGGDATTPTTVGPGPALSVSPGRVDPASSAWQSSRKPLAGEFRWQGQPLFVIGNHFNSKGGDQPLHGRFQPPARSSETQRRQQAAAVNAFVDAVRAQDAGARVVVLGDLNDFEFSDTLQTLRDGGALADLVSTLPENERYTYVFDGNSQALDHILLTPGLSARPFEYDVVHANAEFAGQISDHDPQVVRLSASPTDSRTPRGTVPPIYTSAPLTSGQRYTVTVRGTHSRFDASLMKAGARSFAMCGTPEDAPLLPSPNTTNSRVGSDAEFLFAFPQQGTRCSAKSQAALPQRQSSLRFDTGGGYVVPVPTTPAGTAPAPDHVYTYAVTGTGQSLRVALPDSNYADNYGQYAITLSPETA